MASDTTPHPAPPGHGHTHGHGHGHGHGAVHAPRRALSYALGITATFMVVEAIAGFLSGSLALLADAGHMLADTGALALALVAQIVADRPRSTRSTYGFRRAEVLAAFVNGIALAVVSVLVFKEALERWFEPAPIVGSLMLVTAVLGLVVNCVAALILFGGRSQNVNVRAAFMHVVVDAMGSVAAIVAGVLVVALGWLRADPALSVGISLLVFVSGYRILRETTNVLLESAPHDLPVADIQKTILSCPGVCEVHDLHVWRISQGFDTLTAHVVLEPGHHGVAVSREVAERLRREHSLTHVTIQPEAAPPEDTVPVRRGLDGEPLVASSSKSEPTSGPSGSQRD